MMGNCKCLKYLFVASVVQEWYVLAEHDHIK